MKKFVLPLSILALLVSAVVLVSCGDDDDDKKEDPTPQNAAPTVDITNPSKLYSYILSPGTTDSTMDITAVASDSDGQITKVEFFVDGTSIGSVTAAPYKKAYTFQGDSPYTIKAIATDDKGLNTSTTLSTTPVLLY